MTVIPRSRFIPAILHWLVLQHRTIYNYSSNSNSTPFFIFYFILFIIIYCSNYHFCCYHRFFKPISSRRLQNWQYCNSRLTNCSLHELSLSLVTQNSVRIIWIHTRNSVPKQNISIIFLGTPETYNVKMHNSADVLSEN